MVGLDFQIKLYDNALAETASYSVTIPESANSVQLLNTYATDYFDTDSGVELAVYVHYFDPNIPGPEGAINEIWLIDDDAQIIKKIAGTSMWLKTTADGTKRLFVYDVKNEISIKTYNPQDFSLVGSYSFSSDLLLNFVGVPVNFATIDGQEYLVVAHYESLFMDNATLEVFPDNHLIVKLLDFDFQEDKSFTLNIDSHYTDLGAYTVPMAEFGIFYKDNRYDLTTDVFDADAEIEIAYGVHYFNLIGDDEWSTYRVANEDGTIVHQLDEYILSVNYDIKELPGHDNQLGFLVGEDGTPTQISFFDIESWSMVATFDALQANEDRLSDRYNRIKAGDTYHYLIGVGSSDSVDDQLFGVVNEYSKAGQLLKRHQLPIAPETQMFQPVLTANALTPNVFTTESDSLYLAYAYLEPAANGTKYYNFKIAHDADHVLAEFRGDSNKGPVVAAGILPNVTGTGFDKLSIQYQTIGATALVEFYTLPLEGESMSVEKEELVQLKLYPNPVINTLHIQAQTPVKSVETYNITGQLQIQKALDIDRTSLDVSQLTTGIYFVEVHLENGTVKQSKLIKR